MDRRDEANRPAWREEPDRIEVREEELRARTERVRSGEVRIDKQVVGEEQTIEVPVTHEEAVVERRAVDRRPSDAPIGEGETVGVTLYAEEVEVEKRPVVYEELSVGKQQVRETERVADTVRREVVDANPEGDVDMRGWDQVRGAQRETWEKRFKGTGRRWEDVEPGYRYSHEMAGDPRFRDRDFDEAEPELRADYGEWSRRRGYRPDDGDGDDSAWQGLRNDAREAWEEARQTGRRR